MSKTIAPFFAVLLLTLSVIAKEREWQDAVVEDAQTGTAGSVAMASATGTRYSAVGVGIAAAIIVTYYHIDTKNVSYVAEVRYERKKPSTKSARPKRARTMEQETTPSRF